MIRLSVILLCLAGCGGSGGGGSAVTMATYSAYHQSVVDLGVAPLSLVPDRGAQNYAGQMALDIPIGAPAETYIGNFDLSIRMDGTDLAASGGVNGFQNAAGDVLGGRLAFSGGDIFEAADPGRDFLMSADLAGQLTKDAIIYDLSAKLQGDFFGNNVEGIAGVIYAGRITQGGDLDIFDGSFAGALVP